MLTHTTFRIQDIVLGWQMVEITDSAFWVGLVAFAYGVPLLIWSPITGLLADWAQRQRIIAIALMLAAVSSAGLALLTGFEATQPVHILVASFALGTAFTIYAPARLALLPNLVPGSLVINASTFEYSSTRLMGFFGPVAAGLLVAAIGTSSTLFVQMALFVGAGLIFWRAAAAVRQPDESIGQSRNVWHGFRDVLNYLRGDPPVLALVVWGLIIVPVGMTHLKLMPVFVREALGAGASTLGLLVGVASLGTALTGFVVAAMEESLPKGPAVLVSSFAFGGGLMALSLTQQSWAALVILLAVGLSAGIFLTLSNALFQARAPNAVRGRVMSVWGMVWGLIPFTSLVAGAAAERWSVTMVIAVSGALCAIFSIGMLLKMPELRKL